MERKHYAYLVDSKVTINRAQQFWQTEHEVYDQDNVALGKDVTRIDYLIGQGYYPYETLNTWYKTQVFFDRESIPKGLYVEGKLHKDAFLPSESIYDNDYDYDGLVFTKTPHGFWGATYRDNSCGILPNSNALCRRYNTRFKEVDCPAMKSWSEDFDKIRSHIQESTLYLNSTSVVYLLVIDFILERPEFVERLTSPIDARLVLFSPFPSKLNPGNLSITPSHAYHKSDRQVSMKPGKAFRKMFPEATQQEVDQFVDAYRIKMPTQKLTIHEGVERKDFRHMYQTDFSRTENIHTTHLRKSLACSCMKYNFGDIHPAEQYASGDFKAYWTEDENGNICSRVVVCTKDNLYGPIYGTTEYSIDLLEEHLRKDGFESGGGKEDEAWEDAKILYLPDPRNDEVVYYAYIDFGLVPDAKTPCGQFLTLTRDYDEIPHEGFFNLVYGGGGARRYCCQHCGDRHDEDDLYYDDHDIMYCYDCWNNEFGHCEFTGGMFDKSLAIEVKIPNYWNDRLVTATTSEEWVDEYCNYAEHEGVWYKKSVTVELYNESGWAYEKDPALQTCPITGNHYLEGEETANYTDENGVIEGETLIEILGDEGYIYDETREVYLHPQYKEAA